MLVVPAAVEESRAARQQRQQARFRDRGGCVPNDHNRPPLEHDNLAEYSSRPRTTRSWTFSSLARSPGNRLARRMHGGRVCARGQSLRRFGRRARARARAERSSLKEKRWLVLLPRGLRRRRAGGQPEWETVRANNPSPVSSLCLHDFIRLLY